MKILGEAQDFYVSLWLSAPLCSFMLALPAARPRIVLGDTSLSFHKEVSKKGN
jgi:hypothetical protein